MSILVTGGLGFIGSNLVDQLILKGKKVIVIDDLSTGLKLNKNKKANYIYHDIRSYLKKPRLLVNLIKKYKIKVVFHLAASADVRLSMKHPEEVFEINLLSSITLFNIAINHGVKKFIFTSTSAVYGEPNYFPVNEKHPIDPISTYGLSKLAFEKYIYLTSLKTDISTIIFRLPNVYGQRQRSDLEAGVIAIFDEQMRIKKKVTIYGDGYQSRDWVHVNDIVNALTKSIKIKLGYEIIGLGSRKKYTVNQLFELLSQINNYYQKPVFKKLRAGDVIDMVMCNKKAKKILNWAPKINLKDGLKRI